MIFTEARFFVFFVVVLAVHWSLRRCASRKIWLLVSSYAFYAAWDARFLSLILFSTVVDFVAGGRISRPGSRRRAWLAASLVCNLGVLGLFKYYDFFVESASAALEGLGLGAHDATLGLILPLGISFYTFQTLSYTIDVYRGKLTPTRSLLDFALFVAFFPQLVAGPIVRAREFLPQLTRTPRFLDVDLRPFVALFIAGFFKKACVADNIAAVVDPVFFDPTAFSAGAVWLSLVLYVVQIYCDFSGYTDMAIATAGMLGYRLPLNFDFPYLSNSVTEFWRRWHMTMMRWFRDYLYISIGGNRRGMARTYFNLVLTFALSGLWHGARWNFVLFGLFNGLFLILERWARRSRGFDPLATRWWGKVYVMSVVAITFVLFRSATLAEALTYLGSLWPVGAADGLALDSRWWLVLPPLIALHLAARRGWADRLVQHTPGLLYSLGVGCVVAVLLSLVATDYQPFIYFQF